MVSTFFGLEIARSGLSAQQTALNTTGHNIANANTPGYSRQRVNMEASPAYTAASIVTYMGPAQMGTGVMAGSIERLREAFLDLQYQGENKNLGEYTATTDTLEKIETIMGEPSDTGFRSVMDQFWNSWQKVSQPSSGYSTREFVIQQGHALAENFNFIDRELKSLQQDVDSQIQTRAEQMNTIVTQIADLNRQIMDVVPHGYVPNDLYDKRDVLIDQLSNMLDIEVTRNDYVASDGKKSPGTVDIKLKNPSTDLVVGNDAADIKAGDSGTLANDGTRHGIFVNGTEIEPDAGEIYGLLKSRDTTIASYMNKMNDLANAIITQVNSAHGTDFFTGDSAGNMGVAITDPNDVAKSSTPGDNSIALAVYNLKTTAQTIGTGAGAVSASFDDFTRGMITTLGIETEKAQRMKENTTNLLKEVDNRRQSVSGVSLDEEMSNMIKFQHGYNAAARTMTAMDEMLDKIINSMGLVGR